MISRTNGRWPLTLLMAMALISLPAYALAQGKKKPRGGETPAPGAETPAPGAETPAPGAETPAPGAETPAPGAETPAPGAETPAPRPELPPTAPPRPEKPVEKPKAGPEPAKPPKPVLPAVKSKYGSVQISGALAARLVMPFRTISGNYQTMTGAGNDQNVAFELAGAWLKLDGHVGTKNLEYEFRLGYGMHELLLLDVKLTFHLPWVKGLSISAGRFFPEFGLVGHRVFTRLETAEYPIYLTEGGMGVWSQLGVSIDYRRKIGPGVIHGAIGVYNGVPDSFTDDNNHKDLFILATYGFTSGPIKGLMAGINAWIGFPHCVWDEANPAMSTCTAEDALKNEADTEMKIGVLLAFKRQFTNWVGANVLAEFWFRRYTPWAENRDPWSSIAFWLHAGVPIGKYLEPLVRFEYFKDMTKDATGSTDGDNWVWRLTAGLNIYLYKIHSHIKINYIFESWGDTFANASWIDMHYGTPATLPGPPAVRNVTPETNVHLLLISANTEF